MVHDIKLTKTHIANLVLSLFAFALFVLNQWHELAGSHLDLRGQSGATILAGFLAAGIIVQIAKMMEGHRTGQAVVVTLVLLAVHVVAELTIWVRTQIMQAGLPLELPYYVIGVYWTIGLVDVLSMFIMREVGVLRGTYKPPAVRFQEEIEQLRSMLEDAQLVIHEKDKENALLEHTIGTLEHAQSMLEQRLSTVEERYERRMTDLKDAHAQERQRWEQRAERAQQEASKTYVEYCPHAHCEWDTGEKDSAEQAKRSLAAHIGREHGGEYPNSANGHRRESIEA